MKRDDLPTPFLAALTTAPSVETAKRLVRTLVERRLIACGTVIPGALSTYWWQGAVAEALSQSPAGDLEGFFMDVVRA